MTETEEMVVYLTVVLGDAARNMRDTSFRPDDQLLKEFGNLLLMILRYLDDLGKDPVRAVELAVAAQRSYLARNG